MLCTAHGWGAGICGSGERCVLVLQPRGAEHSPIRGYLGVRVFWQGAGAAQGIVWSCVSV